MSTSADAQSVASLADIALVAVELRRTGYTEVSDAAEQLRRVGTPLLGAVVLPKLSRRRGEGPAAAPAAVAETGDEFAGPDTIGRDETEPHDPTGCAEPA